ncbi:MAG: TetR/AcrR family transcriptional regulator C-terminal domain-containing protein [Bacilli bacterium]
MNKYEEQSLNTKKKIANSLKKLMLKKKFNQISINDIVTDCNLNRNSFYYHFDDIYSLLKWIFEMDAGKILKEIETSKDMKKAISLVMQYIDDNRDVCICAYDSLGRDELKKFFINNFEIIIIKLIDNVIECNNYIISNDFKNYIIYSHTELIASHLISYLKGDFKISKEKIINYILVNIYASIETSLKIASDNKL